MTHRLSSKGPIKMDTASFVLCGMAGLIFATVVVAVAMFALRPNIHPAKIQLSAKPPIVSLKAAEPSSSYTPLQGR